MTVQNLDQEKCTGCGICVACCPMDVLRIDEETGKVVTVCKECADTKDMQLSEAIEKYGAVDKESFEKGEKVEKKGTAS